MSNETCSIHNRIARASHAHCVICGEDDPLDLDLKFQTSRDGSMSVIVFDGTRFQGYPNRLHGGIISMLFDAAMTHCLFARGLTGVTAALNVRFLQPVSPEQAFTVSAQVEKRKSHLYLLRGLLKQKGELKSTAEARFWLVSEATGQTLDERSSDGESPGEEGSSLLRSD